MKRIFFFLSLFALFFTATAAPAQLSSSKQLMGLFREVIAKPHQSTVRIKADGKDAALGVVISADGWILTKLSELKGTKSIVCLLPDGKELPVQVFGSDEPFDLLMVKVDATGLTPIVWTSSDASKVGHWVASVGTDAEPVALGVLSVAARKVKGAKTFSPSGSAGGYLGIALDQSFDGVKVIDVLEKQPAIKAGVKANDLILSVNGQAVANSEEFKGILSRKKPGDVVTLKINRDDKELDIMVKLGESPGSIGGKSRGEQQNSMGSELSERRAGFPVILQHDSIVKPHDCGGPLVNLEGKVLGINIARAGRTESYAIPSETIQPMLEGLKKGKTDLTVEKKDKAPEEKKKKKGPPKN